MLHLEESGFMLVWGSGSDVSCMGFGVWGLWTAWVGGQGAQRWQCLRQCYACHHVQLPGWLSAGIPRSQYG